ncbi:MAG: hypothetical protein Q8O64_18515, partial [Sideroxyarcus sp.]|nr:hypothetical protein [Sideroxyarcus sp.]
QWYLMMKTAMPVSLSPGSLPQAGERDAASLREFHVKYLRNSLFLWIMLALSAYTRRTKLLARK